jgi:hypothetical protein
MDAAFLERIAATVFSNLLLAAPDHFFNTAFSVEALGYRVPFGVALPSAAKVLSIVEYHYLLSFCYEGHDMPVDPDKYKQDPRTPQELAKAILDYVVTPRDLTRVNAPTLSDDLPVR